MPEVPRHQKAPCRDGACPMNDLSPSTQPACPSFRVVHDPEWLYPADPVRSVLSRFDATVAASHAVTLITGDGGTGKTLILNVIDAKYRDRFRIGWLQPDEGLSQPLTAALEAWRVDVPDLPMDQLVERTRQFLETSHNHSRGTILLLDDAHLLGDEELERLRQITDLRTAGAPLIQLVLSGLPELQQRLAETRHRGLQRHVGAHLHLDPFSASETVGYVAHRFSMGRCACHKGRSPFENGCFRILHQTSGGVAGRLNDAIQHCLAEADEAGLPTIGAAFVHKTLRALGLEQEKAKAKAEAEAASSRPATRPASPPPDKAAPKADPAPSPMPVPELAVVSNDAKAPSTAVAPARPRRKTTGRKGGVQVALGLAFIAAASAAAVFYWNDVPWSERANPAIASGPAGGDASPSTALGAAELRSGEAETAPTAPETEEAVLAQPNTDAGAEPDAAAADAPTEAQPVIPAPDIPSGLPRVGSILPFPDADALVNTALTVGMASPALEALLYERAALWGHPRAAYYLGQSFEAGYGVGVDINRARGWYSAADGVWGAQVRLEALEGSPVVTGLNSQARPVMQAVYPDGQTEIHWRAAAEESPVRFAVDYIMAGGDGEILRAVTDRSAILLDGPIARWRLVTLDVVGADAEAGDWMSPAPGGR